MSTYYQKALSIVKIAHPNAKPEQLDGMAMNRYRSKDPRAMFSTDIGALMPLVKSVKGTRDLVYDYDTQQSLLSVMPALAPIYVYSSNRTNFIAGCDLRYPLDRPGMTEVFADTYADFLT